MIAALWAIGVLAEIVLFAVSGRLPRFLSPTMLLICAALGGAVRWTAMAFEPPALLLPFVQLLHALTFGAAHLGALGFLHKYAPARQSATAQGYLAIAMGAVMAATTGLSGVLFERFGSLSYVAMTLAAIAGGACGLVAHRARREAGL